ncbi:hypothetical protein LFT48_22260 (plasmid) [Arthrobacter sp. FW305-123]|nr:hypothetical protein LFT48_22260 [Arthrobacter sp. FW305-123]
MSKNFEIVAESNSLFPLRCIGVKHSASSISEIVQPSWYLISVTDTY